MCNGGRSLCGNPPGASVSRSPAPRRRGLSCSPSPPTSRAGGSTRRSPCPVSSEEDSQRSHVQQATTNLKDLEALRKCSTALPLSEPLHADAQDYCWSLLCLELFVQLQPELRFPPGRWRTYRGDSPLDRLQIYEHEAEINQIS